MKRWYDTDPNDPIAPIRLEEYNGLKDGMSVRYHNPISSIGLEGPLTVSAIHRMGVDGPVQAILNDGEYEVNADNLLEEVLCPFDGMWPCVAGCPSMQERACVNGP